METIENNPPILLLVERSGGVVFRGDPYDLNITALRRKPSPGVVFGDLLIISYRKAGRWVSEYFPAQTVPTEDYLQSPMRETGAAILATGQHRGAWKRGLHRGRPALVQTGAAVRISRDNDKDATPEATEATETGYFGLNVHDLRGDPSSASAGCIVVPNSGDIARVLALANAQIIHGFGERFSVTILEDGGKLCCCQ